MKKLVDYSNVSEIPVDQVKEGSVSLRKHYDEKALDELGRSVTEFGLIYPILVESLPGGGYDLIVGSRRLLIARKLKLAKISAVILNKLGERSKLELALSENLHRCDLTPFEEAWAILKLVNGHKLTLKQVAQRIGREESYLSRRLKLLSLPKEVQELVSGGQVSITQVDTLTTIASPTEQVQFARIVARHSLGDEELKTLVDEELQRPRARRKLDLNWQRTSLKIKSFTKWLEAMFPDGIDINRRSDKQAVLESLRGLAEITKISTKRVEKIIC